MGSFPTTSKLCSYDSNPCSEAPLNVCRVNPSGGGAFLNGHDTGKHAEG